MRQLAEKIYILDDSRKFNKKASEEYVSVRFVYDNNEIWEGWIPVEYRRTGVSIKDGDDKELLEYLLRIYPQLDPKRYDKWLSEQKEYWSTSRAKVTKPIFEILSDCQWHCRKCDIDNPNFARRIQDLKEKGYTISTHLNYHCPICGNSKSTRLILLPLDRVEIAGNGYETWSKALRKRILKVLNNYDVFESKVNKNLLPDHKFSEIRWDENTKAENPDSMSDQEIRDKFQLLSNQRNQQKREVCRNCFQTGKRGTIHGINFFYEGSESWDETIPLKGKEAERGCVGCPWYDINEWKTKLQDTLESIKDYENEMIKIKGEK